MDQARHPSLPTAPIQPSPPPSATASAHSVGVPTPPLPSVATLTADDDLGLQQGLQQAPKRPARPSSPIKNYELRPQSPRRARRSTLTDSTSVEVEAMFTNLAKAINSPPRRGSLPPPLSPVSGPYPRPGSPQRPSSPIRAGSALLSPAPPRQRPPRARACTRGMSAPPTQSPAVDTSSLFDPNPHTFDRLGHFHDTHPEARRTVDDIFAEAAARQSLSAALPRPLSVPNANPNGTELTYSVAHNATGSSAFTTPTSSPHPTAAYTEPAVPQTGLMPITRFAPPPMQLSTTVQAQERGAQRGGGAQLPFRALSAEPEAERATRRLNEGRLRFCP